jgi:hypothetical protein
MIMENFAVSLLSRVDDHLYGIGGPTMTWSDLLSFQNESPCKEESVTEEERRTPRT